MTDTTSRCAICDWPLHERVEDGCTADSCSYRPRRATIAQEWRAALAQERRAALARGETAAATAPAAPPTKERWAPVKQIPGFSFPPRVPWALSERAWSQYAAFGHENQSHERLCERGGFDPVELVSLLHGRNPFRGSTPNPTPEEVAKVRDEIEGVAALRAKAEKAEAERDAALARVAAEAGNDLAAWAADLDAAESRNTTLRAERDTALTAATSLNAELARLREALDRPTSERLGTCPKCGHPVVDAPGRQVWCQLCTTNAAIADADAALAELREARARAFDEAVALIEKERTHEGPRNASGLEAENFDRGLATAADVIRAAIARGGR